MPEAPTRETPGERLKTLRKRAAISQAELGLRVNLSQGRISQLVNVLVSATPVRA